MEIDAGIKHNQFSPGRICWFAKQFDGINEADDASDAFIETEQSRKVRMVELNDQLRNFREVSVCLARYKWNNLRWMCNINK